MHMIIYALVEASTTDEALAAGRTVFNRLTGIDGTAFDYYVTFDDESTSVAGRARWGERPIAAPLDSQQGQELLERGWETTTTEFHRYLDQVKTALDELTDEQIMRNEARVRFAFRQLGAREGPVIILYDQYGSGIRNPDELDRIQKECEDLWIVPADVHF